MNSIAESIQTAIDRNLDVQREAMKQLKIVVQLKVNNREAAQKLLEAYRMCLMKVEQDATPPPVYHDDRFYANLGKEIRNKLKRWNAQPNGGSNKDGVANLQAAVAEPASATTLSADDDDHDEAAAGGLTGTIKPAKKFRKPSLTAKQLKQAFQEDRKWNLHYFIDPLGSIPEPNEDTKLRNSILEGDGAARIIPLHGDISLYHWTKDEILCLEQSVREQRQLQSAHECDLLLNLANVQPNKANCQPYTDTPSTTESGNKSTLNGDSQIDFVAVAKLFNSRTKPKLVKRGTTQYSISIPRTAVECRNKYLYSVSPHINKSPWTKEESMKLLELVHSYRQDHDDHPPWDEVAQKMNTNRTPWQYFTHYQKDLNTSRRSLPWTEVSDELLFKYVSSQGPRFILNNTTATTICREVLPNRCPKQILARCTRSLLNPNFAHGPWTEEEERKLVILMKIYRDCNNPIDKASLHFPHRATKMVWDKWERSLNPEYLTRPWTTEEDQALLAAVERYEGGWITSSAEICEEFPLRRTKQLYNRWLDLIDEDCLVRHRHESLKNKAAKASAVSSSTKETLLDPNDLVVQVKRKRRR
jgi:hypothetical protein